MYNFLYNNSSLLEIHINCKNNNVDCLYLVIGIFLRHYYQFITWYNTSVLLHQRQYETYHYDKLTIYCKLITYKASGQQAFLLKYNLECI